MALNTRITHALAEVLRDGNPKARITHALSEVLRDGIPKARITHIVVEVLRVSRKICGVTNQAKIDGVAVANIAKINRVES